MPYLNATTGNCSACPGNSTLNTTSGKCGCAVGYFLDPKTGVCLYCPHPYHFDTRFNVCVKCPPGFVYLTQYSACGCPSTKPYLLANSTCTACNTFWNTTTRACVVCKSNSTWNATAKKCECHAPYYADAKGKCVYCPGPSQGWDAKNKSCIVCLST